MAEPTFADLVEQARQRLVLSAMVEERDACSVFEPDTPISEHQGGTDG